MSPVIDGWVSPVIGGWARGGFRATRPREDTTVHGDEEAVGSGRSSRSRAAMVASRLQCLAAPRRTSPRDGDGSLPGLLQSRRLVPFRVYLTSSLGLGSIGVVGC